MTTATRIGADLRVGGVRRRDYTLFLEARASPGTAVPGSAEVSARLVRGAVALEERRHALAEFTVRGARAVGELEGVADVQPRVGERQPCQRVVDRPGQSVARVEPGGDRDAEAAEG